MLYRSHYTKENIYEEFMRNFTKLLTHLSFFIYFSAYIVEEYVKNLWRVCNRLLFKILHNQFKSSLLNRVGGVGSVGVGCVGGVGQILGWVAWVHKILAWVTRVVWVEILAWVAWVQKILTWLTWLVWVRKAAWVNVLLFNHTLQKTLRLL